MAILGYGKKQRKLKKTRQGAGRGTKWGTKGSKKRYVKRYRGQGGPKRRKA